ncbi:MAG: hypothetical protein ABI972_13090 [Acidobacteriota bacterium]
MFLCLAPLLVWQMRTMDRTNIATTNGLWKAPSVRQWEVKHDGPIDSGGQAYLPLLGRLCEYSPDSWWRYGANLPTVTFREIAAWNSVFSAFATALVFGLVWNITSDVVLAALTAFFHATAAFVVIHTLNSEDIMPGYSMFVLALYGFFRVASGDTPLLWVPVSSAGLGLATLLHWTLAPPAIAGLGLAHLVFLWENPLERWRISVGALTAYLVVLKAWTLLLAPGSHVGVWQVLYPAKASGSGWVGLLPSKFLLLLVAIPNYFTAGYNMGFYEGVFGPGPYRTPLLIGYAWLLVCLAGFAYALTRKGLVRLFAICVAGVFLVGQAENVYSQPQDPQMQIQPMFIGVAGFLGLLLFLRQRMDRRKFLAVAFGVALPVVVANYTYTLQLIARGTQTDSNWVHLQESLRQKLPPETSFLVLVGFESLVTWESTLYLDGKPERLEERHLLLATPFTWVPRAGSERTAKYMMARMEAARGKGLRLFADTLWVESRDDFQKRVLTVVSPEVSGKLYDIMRPLYKPIGKVAAGRVDFVEIVPANP